jgi:hypothetical protein
MKPSFNRRKATSFGLLFSFTILLVSGVILWAFPRIASFSSAAEFGGVSKPVWLDQHIVFGVLFTLLSLYHLFGVNRELFFSYLKKSASTDGQRHPELLTTLLATALIAVVTALHIPYSLKTGDDSAVAVKRNDGDRDAAYGQREKVSERSRHHHFDEDEEWRHASPQLADRGDAAGASDEAQFSAGYQSDSRSANNGAPDDELHRRTTASCASCH